MLKSLKQMGRIVDRRKPGYGNTNDGNTAHRFFLYKKKSGEKTGLDIKLIKKFSVLLKAIISGHEVDCVKFEKLCFETRTLYSVL